MATNDFLPFATAAGANVLPPATWNPENARLLGFVAGTANSAQVNTVLRQAQFVSSMIAQFIADTLSQNVVDNGNLSTLETQFIAALQASSGAIPTNALWHFGRDVGAANSMSVVAAPIVTAYGDGLPLAVIINHDSTVSNPTLSANGLLATTIVNFDGSALSVGALKGGSLGLFVYDAALPAWRLLGTLIIPQTALLHFGADVGSRNAMTVNSVYPAISAVTTGMQFTIKKSGQANDGPMTCTIAGTTANVTWPDGTAFTGGEWAANADGQIVFDGNFKLLGPTTPFPAVSQQSLVHYGADTGSQNLMSCNVLPAITSISDGMFFEIKPNVTNSSSVSFNPSGTGPRAVVYKDGSAMLPSEIVAGQPIQLMALGSNFILMKDGGGQRFPNLVIFQSSGLYTPSVGAKKALMIATAGGGGGSSGAGGGGGTALGMYSLAGVTNLSVVIGAGGAPGVHTVTASDGGTTTVGSLLRAYGGKGGHRNNYGTGGAGGLSDLGQLLIQGDPGSFESVSGPQGPGGGGGSFWGGGGAGGDPNINGDPGHDGQLGGGGGGQYWATSGGAGGTGVVFVLEF